MHAAGATKKITKNVKKAQGGAKGLAKGAKGALNKATKGAKKNLPKGGKALKGGGGDSWYGPDRALFLGESLLKNLDVKV